MSENIVDNDLNIIIKNIKDFSGILQNKTILIVGGRGFLGTYFVKTLQRLNQTFENPSRILVLDSRITEKNTENVDDSNTVFLERDISEKISIDEKIDFIIHSASIASPPIYRKYPLKTVDVNYQGTRNLLELAKQNKIKSMLFLSSSEIYGDPHIVPTPENYWGNVSNVGPRACYDESKRLAETICILFSQLYDTPIKIARPFNVYGPFLKLDDGRMIPDFMKDAFKKSKIIIHSDGTPTRSFCYISDAIIGFFKVFLLGVNGSIFNVGNDDEITVKEAAKSVKNCFKKDVEICFEKSVDPNYTIDNPQRRCPDLTKIKNDVGYFPQITFEEGIKRLHTWYLGDMK